MSPNLLSSTWWMPLACPSVTLIFLALNSLLFRVPRKFAFATRNRVMTVSQCRSSIGHLICKSSTVSVSHRVLRISGVSRGRLRSWAGTWARLRPSSASRWATSTYCTGWGCASGTAARVGDFATRSLSSLPFRSKLDLAKFLIKH